MLINFLFFLLISVLVSCGTLTKVTTIRYSKCTFNVYVGLIMYIGLGLATVIVC